jgi:hypothetical protein
MENVSLNVILQSGKERIKRAFAGELLKTVEDGQPVYESAEKEACESFILSVYETAVFNALTATASQRALQQIIGQKGGGMTLDEYTPVFAREVSRLPYQYEEPKEEKEQTDQKP